MVPARLRLPLPANGENLILLSRRTGLQVLPPSYSGDASAIEARPRSSEIAARANVLGVSARHWSTHQSAPGGALHDLKACSQQACGWRCFAAAGPVWHQY